MARENIFFSTILTCVVHFENEKLMLAVLIYTKEIHIKLYPITVNEEMVSRSREGC